MSVVLVVEQDAGRAGRIRHALRGGGFSVETAASRADALSNAARRAPDLVLASSTLPDAAALIADFSRRRGGPGVVAVIPADQAAPADVQADAILDEPFSDDEVRKLVRRCLADEADRQPATSRSSSGSEHLTSDDIFGEVLAEVEAEARGSKSAPRARRPAPPMGDIERKLEETLSGVIPSVGKKKRPGSTPAESQGRPRRRRPVQPTEAEIDDLLDQTLSSLDISTRSKKPRKSATAATPAPAKSPANGVPPAEAPAPGPATGTETPSRPEPEPIGGLPEPPPAPLPSYEPAPSRPEPADAIVPEPPPLYESPSRPEPEPAGASVPEPPPPRISEHASPAAPSSDAPPEGTGAPAAFRPSPAPDAGAPAARSPDAAMPGLDDPQPPEDQFRTMQLPTLGLGARAQAGEIFGDYTLLDRIAVGGMAEVWRARRRGVEGFQKTVAIKKILSHLTGSPDFVTMFIDEAKLAAQLSHNNIIQIYDLGKVGDAFFIAMEHVDGKDLRSILTAAQQSQRPVSVGLGLLIVSAVARALDYAHRKRDFDNRAMGLVHRDVSPQNVLISYEGAIKLCDFGIVKAVAKASTTQMGALKGKLQYMSPEQAWGKSVDARSDIFSLGSVLFEVLTGTQLFTGESEIGVLDAVRECRIPSPRKLVPEIPEKVAAIVFKALAKSPDERYQTAADLEHDIGAVLDHLRQIPSQNMLAAYMRSLFDAPVSGAIAITPPDAAAVEKPAVAASGEPSPPPSTEAAADAPVAGPPAPAEAESQSGRWKWLAAAVLAAGLIGAGILTLPSLMPKKGPAAPATVPQTSAEDAAPEAAPTVLPGPPEAAAGTAPDDQAATADSTGETGGTADTGTAEPDTADATAEDPAGAAEPPAAGQGVTAAGIDIEKMVNEELTSRAERLRRDFEAEKKRIEEELAKTQAESPPPPPPPPPPKEDEDEGGG